MSINLSLNVNEMEEYLFNTYEDNIMDKTGIHYIFRFPNNYGASVVKSYGTMGYENDKWELACILFDHDEDTIKASSDITTLSPEFYIVYPPNIFHGRYPLGNLTDENVYNLLKDIKNLK